MLIKTAILATIGLLISAYGYWVKQKIKKDPTYKPSCDISDNISCSKPFLSPYGKLMGFSNTLVGMGFYSLVLVLSALGHKIPLFYLSAGALGFSVYLAYILYFKIRSLCLLCSAIYGINIGLLLASYGYLAYK